MKKIPVTFQTEDVENVKIFYREAGDPQAPSVLPLHDFPPSSLFFDTGHFALETHACEIGSEIRGFLNDLPPPAWEENGS